MSDGPHRSLDLPRQWKAVVRSAAIGASTHDERCEKLRIAVHRDLRGGIPSKLLKTLGRYSIQRQISLDDFDLQTARLDELRTVVAGHPLAVSLLDHTILAVARGVRGHEALSTALRDTLVAHLTNIERHIHEHCVADASPESELVLNRLPEVFGQLDIVEATDRLIAPEPAADPPSPRRRTGLDDGVSLL